MRKYMLFLLIGAAVVFGCKKNDNAADAPYDPCALQATPAETTAVEKFLSDSGVSTAARQCGGVYYEIKNPGTGVIPTVYSYLTVTYRGSYVQPGAKTSIFFEETTNGPVAFNRPLLSLIDGWKKGVPLIKKGGNIVLYIPPSLGYGAVAAGAIPANSILIFTIQLVDVQ